MLFEGLCDQFFCEFVAQLVGGKGSLDVEFVVFYQLSDLVIVYIDILCPMLALSIIGQFYSPIIFTINHNL